MKHEISRFCDWSLLSETLVIFTNPFTLNSQNPIVWNFKDVSCLFFSWCKNCKIKKFSVISKICWQLCVSVKLAVKKRFSHCLGQKDYNCFHKKLQTNILQQLSKLQFIFFFFQTLVLHLVLVGCGEYHGDIPSLSVRLICSISDHALIFWLVIPLRSLKYQFKVVNRF